MSRKLMNVSLMLGLCVLTLALSQTATAKAKGAKRVATGVWGGEHMRLNVTRTGATIEYDCGDGTIDAPLTVDRRGSFNLKGTHSRGHGGPIRIDVPDVKQAASYTGVLRGNVLTLTVKLTDMGDTLGTYTLRLGREPRLMRCY